MPIFLLSRSLSRSLFIPYLPFPWRSSATQLPGCVRDWQRRLLACSLASYLLERKTRYDSRQWRWWCIVEREPRQGNTNSPGLNVKSMDLPGSSLTLESLADSNSSERRQIRASANSIYIFLRFLFVNFQYLSRISFSERKRRKKFRNILYK